MKKIAALGCGIAILTFSIPAFSINFSFLYDSPVQYFNNTDWKMLEHVADNALNTDPNGQKTTWENPKTRSGGSVQPLDTSIKNGLTCRDLKMFIHAHERTDQYVFMFCKVKNDWKIRSLA